MIARPSDREALQDDDGPLGQRAHDAESAYPKNDQPDVAVGDEGDRRQGDGS